MLKCTSHALDTYALPLTCLRLGWPPLQGGCPLRTKFRPGFSLHRPFPGVNVRLTAT